LPGAELFARSVFVDLPASAFDFLVKVVWDCADDTGVCAGFILETSPFIFLIKAVVSIWILKLPE